jgi:hypothetical protein
MILGRAQNWTTLIKLVIAWPRQIGKIEKMAEKVAPT